MAAPAVPTVASANSNSSSYAVSVPVGTANGDLLVGVVASDFGTSAGNSFPAAWTALTTSTYDGGTDAVHVKLYARVASSEPATYTISHDNSDSVAAILRITGWDSAAGIAGAVKQVAPSTTGAGTTAPSITPWGSDDLLITFHGAESTSGGSRTWTPATGMTEDVDRQSSIWMSLLVAHLANPATPSGTKVATPSASVNAGAACTISIKAVSSGTTGTIAVTQAGNTSTASGQLGYSGTSARTQESQTSAASGTVVNPVTGTIAGTQADQVSSASGQLGYTGSSARTQADQTSSATGQLGYTGTASPTQAGQVGAASGTFTAGGSFAGSIAVMQANQTSTATGILGYSGTAAVTQAANIASASGTVVNPITGTVSVTQANQLATATGILGYSGTIAATEGSDTSAASGVVSGPVSGSIAVAQASQTASITGLFEPLVSLGTASAATGSAATARAGVMQTASATAGSMTVPTATGG